MTDPRQKRVQLTNLEQLESREVLSSSPWLVEAFQRGPVSGMPQGWAQWATDGSADFRVDTGAGLGDQGRLVASANTGSVGRAWLTSSFSADVETSASVFLTSRTSAQLYVRGQNLNTTTPSYYAVSVTRGAEIQLLKVDRGVTTVLGTVDTSDYISNRWITITIRAEGTNVRAFLHRGDTNQFLDRNGVWTRQRTAAVEVRDTAIRSAGQVGFARGGQTADEIVVDSLRVGPVSRPQAPSIVEERFSQGSRVGLPSNWTQWTNASPMTVRTDADETLRLDAGSSTEARAWLTRTVASDAQVSASLYVDSLIPAGIITRGSNLGTDRETAYRLDVKRGLEAQLVKIVGGRETILGTLRSREWLSGLWVQASVITNGNQLRVQIFRSDTGQYLMSNGTWGLTPEIAMQVVDNGISSGSFVGLSRGTGYAGQLIFDNFIVTSAPSRASQAGPIPTGSDKPTTPKNPGEDLPVLPPSPPVLPPSPPVLPPSPPVLPPPPTSPGTLPTVARNYSHIRLANLAYYGTPFGAKENELLRDSIDLVIPNLEYLDDVNAVSPGTPQFIYTNVSNIYLGLLSDWNAYADRNRLDREGAFYHVTSATPFNGMSASAVPVNRFWGVYKSTPAGWTNLTRDARNTGNSFGFGDMGQSVALGYPEKFRELNIDLTTNAGSGWAGEWEYVAAVDANGNPTRWSKLNLGSDGTNGLKRDGRITFDPPRDWVASSVGGSARHYYIRMRTTGAGTAPTVQTILGRDYTVGGKIPAFDKTADRDGDGYLNDAEYGRRRTGFDARFYYESRLFYPNYGPMRYATNISNTGFRNWSVDYHARFLATQPLADGYFVDNSIGRLIIDPTTISESLETYPEDYGSLLGTINRRLMQRGQWLIANTAGGNTTAEPLIRNGVSYLEEFAIRPLSANHVQFDDLAATLKYRREISGRKAYEILDSLPTNNVDANDPRLQLATLAMYYTIADPELSFLMVNGGNEPASGWDRHFIEASEYNIGRPLGEQTQFATGTDPTNASLIYKVYQRRYQNALVLYKPVSYTRGATGTTANNTATTHTLDRLYRQLRADGTMSSASRTITLRNGEGAILIPA
ncbi:MAG: hypothetical protein ACRC8S_17340 [Fimbriiglobus sp.]